MPSTVPRPPLTSEILDCTKAGMQKDFHEIVSLRAVKLHLQYLCDVRKPGKHKEWTMLVLHVEAHTVSYWVTLGLWIKKISFMPLFLLLPHKYKIYNCSCWLFWRNYCMKHTDKGVSHWPNSKARTKVLKPLKPMSSTSETVHGIGTKLSII